jgi:hypothetical protein
VHEDPDGSLYTNPSYPAEMVRFCFDTAQQTHRHRYDSSFTTQEAESCGLPLESRLTPVNTWRCGTAETIKVY